MNNKSIEVEQQSVVQLQGSNCSKYFLYTEGHDH